MGTLLNEVDSADKISGRVQANRTLQRPRKGVDTWLGSNKPSVHNSCQIEVKFGSGMPQSLTFLLTCDL